MPPSFSDLLAREAAVSRASSRRGLLASAALLFALLLLLDLLRPGSLIRRAWTGVGPEPQTPLERTIEDFRRTRGESIRR